jgi:hypothetical protein
MDVRALITVACVALVAWAAPAAHAQAPEPDPALQRSVEELRTSIGSWAVQTDMLNPDGTVARSLSGTYVFSWIIEDRVASGRSEIPELGQISGLLFYINEAEHKVEMVSVGLDGRLWVMTGPLGGNVRTTAPYETPSGGTGMLRFTRLNVTADGFESRMEYSQDGGETWLPGNHQVFRRAGS